MIAGSGAAPDPFSEHPLPMGSIVPAFRPQRLALLLLLAYPLLLLAALWLQRSWLSALAALDLISLLLLGGLLRGHRAAWAAWLAAAVGTGLLLARDQAEIMLLLVPVCINAGMAWFFGRTLRAGQRPLIARAILAFEGEQRLAKPGVAAYARSLTWAWALLLLGQALFMLYCAAAAAPGGILERLALANPLPLPAAWAYWYLHVGGFLVIALFSLAEFLWRRQYLRHLPHDGAQAYFSKVVQNWRRVVDESPGAD